MGSCSTAQILSLVLCYFLCFGFPMVAAGSHPVGGSAAGTTALSWGMEALPRDGSDRGQISSEHPATLYFAQIGNGQGLVSDLVLTNPSSTTAANARVEFFDDSGRPLELGLSSPQGRFSKVDVVVPSLGAVRLTTNGAGTLVPGAARVIADRRVGGVVRFTIPGAGTTGVGESQPSREFLTPARRSGINTGVALHNPGPTPIRLRLTLRSALGVPLANGTTLLDLPALGHTARFINELFDNAGLAGFEGTLGVEVLGQGEVAATALELGGAAGQFTTLPVVAAAQAGTVPYFAQIGNGSGLVSELILANPSKTTEVVAQVQFLNDQGLPLALGLASPPGRLSSVSVAIKPLGMARIATDSLGAAAVAGAVRVNADGQLGGVVRFTIPSAGTTGVGESRPVGGFIIPARRTAINTGLALHNSGQQTIQVRLRLRQANGTLLAGAESTVELEGGGHLAKFADELFKGVNLSGFEGTLTAEVVGGPGRLAATALELGAQTGQFTTLPVTPLDGVPTLSSATAKPGQYIDLRHEAITGGSRPLIRIEGIFGQAGILVEAVAVSAGKARFVVPPVFHASTGAMVQGNVTVRLADSGASAALVIGPPDELAGGEAGALLLWFLSRTVTNYRQARDDLASLGTEHGVDTESLRNSLQLRIAAMEQAVAELQATGRLIIVRQDGSVHVLEAEALRRSDQLLLAFMKGFSGELESAGTGQASPQQAIDIEAWKANFADALDQARKNAGLGVAAIGGGVSLLVGLTVGVPAGAAVLALTGLGYVLSEGVGSEAMAALAHQLRGAGSEGYQFGQELLRSAGDALESFATSVGGEFSRLVNLYDTIKSSLSIYEAFGIKNCDTQHSGQGLMRAPAATIQDFCNDVVPLLPPVALLLAGPLSLAPGQAGAWQILPIGGKAPYTGVVTWGDGGGSDLSLGAGGGSTGHTFTTPGAYPIEVSVRDQTGGYGGVGTLVLVVSPQSLTGIISIPGYLSHAFTPPNVFFGLSWIIEGEDTIVLDRIPTVGGGTQQTPWEAGGELLTIAIHPAKVGLAPFTTGGLGWLNEGADVHLAYTSAEIRNQTDQWPVLFLGVSGTVSVTQLGNQVGDPMSGTFSVQVEGEREVCLNVSCSQTSSQLIQGTISGSFNGTIRAGFPAAISFEGRLR